MAFRFHRSIRLLPGVRLNFSKTGISTSFGVPGFSVNYGTRGRSSSVGIPGTGMSWRQTKSRRRSSSKGTSSARKTTPNYGAEISEASTRPRKPGWFAPKVEKEFAAALNEMSSDALGRVARAHPEVTAAASGLGGLICLQGDNDSKRRQGQDLLELSWATGREPSSEPIARKYMNFSAEFSVPIASGVECNAPLSRNLIALVLAELYQSEGEIEKAIEILDGDSPETMTAVSLSELLIIAKRFDEVIDMTDGITNEDEATALLCVFRGIALREQGMYVAARESFKEALRIRSRDAEVRNRAWIERAACYLAEGKRGMARNDLERIMAVDSDYPGLAEALANLAGATPEDQPEGD